MQKSKISEMRNGWVEQSRGAVAGAQAVGVKFRRRMGRSLVTHYGVKEIANGSFLNSTGFVSFVTMAATSVLANAWSGFKGLKSISFMTKDKMVVLGDSAFAAPQLTRVEFNGVAPDPANVGTIFASLPEKQVTVYVPRDKGWEALADNGVIPGTITKGTRQKIKYKGGLILLVR